MSLIVSVIDRRARVPARVLPRAVGDEAQVRPAPPADRAVPDELPAARARVEGDPRRPGRHQLVPLLDAPALAGASDLAAALQPVRGHARARATSGCRSSRCRSSSRSRTSTSGCSRPRATSARAGWRAFFAVTLPLSLPGVIAAFFFVFIPTIGEFVTPSLVGGAGGYMYGNQIVDMFGDRLPRLGDGLGARAVPDRRGRDPDGGLLALPAAAAGGGRMSDVALSKNGARVLRGVLRARRRLPLRADPDPGHLLVQRLGLPVVPAQRLHLAVVPPVHRERRPARVALDERDHRRR